MVLGTHRLTHTWRFDRMATVCHPATGHFRRGRETLRGVVAICPSRRGNRNRSGGDLPYTQVKLHCVQALELLRNLGRRPDLPPAGSLGLAAA